MRLLVAGFLCLIIFGVTNGRFTGPLRVINGTVDEPNSSPWLAKLTRGHVLEYPCSGTLISKNYVLTAIRCFNWIHLVKSHGVQIELGIWDHAVDETGTLKLETNVNYVTYHEGYNESTHENDIALIKLPHSIEFTDKIQPARLLSEDTVKPGQVGHISGWEYPLTEFVSGHSYLHGGNVTIVNNSVCQTVYPEYVINNNVICASGSVATCYGDEGVTLSVDGKAVGLTYGSIEIRFRDNCTVVPNTYLYIPKYLEWIKANSDYTD